MGQLNRRQFTISAAASAAMLSPLSRVRGANEDIRIAVVGLGGRGGGHLTWFDSVPGARVIAGVDPDRSTHKKLAEKLPDNNAKAYTDIRQMLDEDVCDAVVIATSNQWHCLAGIWSAEAGKDVYCEKPISHNIWEGRQLVKAARKHNKIIQGGTQQRSDPVQAEIKAFLDSGELGKIQFVRLNRFGVRASIGKRSTPLEIPSHVDYDLWLGPARDQPIYREKLQYDWHWDWNTGNGELGNWGPHILDDCRNVVFRDKITLPKRVISGGGRYVWNDGGNTPNTQFTYYDTGDIPVVMAVHNLPYKTGENRNDVYRRLKTRAFLCIQCENGYYAGGRGGGAAYTNDHKVIKKFNGDGGKAHAQNFIDAVRSRKRSDQTAEIEETHYSSAWCHLGNIAYRMGTHYNRDTAMNALKGYGPWEELIEDFHAHTANNGVDPTKSHTVLGPMLELDVEKETFVGPSATRKALHLLAGHYRKGYEIA
ncbi:MAG: Gfo/Idh/MocA family protein [Planctomycetota bacterium]|jgi:predicted dehydrogenase